MTVAVLAFSGRLSAATLPTPVPPYGTDFSIMKNGDPNGLWRLYVEDDAAFDSGTVENGWFLTLITSDPVGQAADVGLSMTVSTNSIIVGSNLVFVVAVTNYGPSTASNVVVVDTLPANADFITNSFTTGDTIHEDLKLTWSVGVLVTNQGASMTITVQPTTTGQILNGANCQTVTSDANPDDDEATASAISKILLVAPELSGTYLSGAGFQISGTNMSSSPLIIQASTNLIDWTSVYTNIPPPASFFFTDPVATNFQNRFYRTIFAP